MIFRKKEKERTFRTISLSVDYVVVGGGLTGVCAAIAAAREGLKVALIQNRPVLGGNASSEVRLWALGATSHMGNNNRWSREGGIIDEILVENVFRNKEGNPVMFDMVLIDKVLAESNITLLLNTVLYDIEKKDNRTIASVKAFNPQNETIYDISGRMFSDCTGDGSLGYLAGASYRVGAEETTLYGEKFAPDKMCYGELMGHSILFYTKDTGAPVKFVAPQFALKDVETLIPKLQNPNYFNVSQSGCKYWWLEYGGRLDTIADTENIKFELWRVVYGIWDYIKNSGKFPETETWTLEWVGLFPGKRESRRFNGLYTLTQRDIIEQRQHYDAVSYGGWAIDLHPADGVYADGAGCHQWHSKGVYQIPYRCYVTPDLDNMFLGGRIISVSHVANGSTRVMCTGALGGEVIGRAAAICLGQNMKPAELAEKENIGLLQAALVRNGNFIPGAPVKTDGNLADAASVEVSSELVLGCLSPDGSLFTLDYSVAQLLPVDGVMPKVSMKVIARRPTTLVVELRSSSKPQNYTPDIIERRLEFCLAEGTNDIEMQFDHDYSSPRYAFVCLMKNPEVSVPMSSLTLTGFTSVYNYINPAVSNFGRQQPPVGIGVEDFEFWCPKRHPESKNLAMCFTPALHPGDAVNLRENWFRPYLGTNAWMPSVEDRSPKLLLQWPEARDISSVTLFFDTDADQAMETVQMGHYEAVVPTCIRDYTIRDSNGKVVWTCSDNHQTVNRVNFDHPVTTDMLEIEFRQHDKNVICGLMGIFVN